MCNLSRHQHGWWGLLTRRPHGEAEPAAAHALLLYLAEVGSIGSGPQEQRLVFADAVLMDGLLVSGLVSHLLGERTASRAGGRAG